MNMRPVPGWKVKVYGFRSPSAQMARLRPVALAKKGLSVGIVPSALMRRILPSRLPSDWALAPLPFSPAAMYSLPSGPKWRAPPLWLVALLRLSRSRMTTSLPGAATSPLAVKRLTRLWIGALAVVEYRDKEWLPGNVGAEATPTKAGSDPPCGFPAT